MKTDPPPADEEVFGRTAPCSVHLLHRVKIRADGSRSGCPMCEDAIQDLTRRK